MTNQLPPVKVAFILDNEIVDILHTDERLSAILLSNPVIKEVTGMLLEDGGNVHLGGIYDPNTDTFIKNDAVEIGQPLTQAQIDEIDASQNG
jgi:hypothetical protein